MLILSKEIRRTFVICLLVVGCGGEDPKQKESTSEVYAQPVQRCNSSPPANYPYNTWQSAPDCAPRAFETRTGVYDPRLQGLQNRGQWIDTGGRTFYDRGPGQLPLPGDIVGYDYDPKLPGHQGHAGVCTGYDANGRCIIATGHQNNPYQVRDHRELDFTYTPAYPSNSRPR
jgi:hypothetical protein